MKLGTVGRQFGVLVLAVGLAACGGKGFGTGGAGPGGGNGASDTASTITLLASSPQLNSSASSAASGLTITALVKDANNNLVSGAPVTFSSNLGAVQVTQGTTDASGAATATLTTGGDPTNQTIVVTAASANVTQTVNVQESGTSLNISGPTVVGMVDTQTFKVTLADSSGQGIAGRTIMLASTLGNGVNPAAQVTDTNGEASFKYVASNSGTDTLTATGLGQTKSTAVSISASRLTFQTPQSSVDIPFNQIQPVNVQYVLNGAPVNGATINFSTTRGTVNAARSASVTTNSSGIASVSLVSDGSDGAGGVIVSAQVGGGGPSATLPVQFVSTTPATVVVQADPSTIQTNETSTILAVVRDSNDNLVKGARVDFNLSDITGGTLSAGFGITDDLGRVTVSYQATSSTSAADGVKISALVDGTSITAAKPATITVTGKALRITLGTGNKVDIPSETEYQLPYSVLVTDAAGNPPPTGTDFRLYIQSVAYQKGSQVFSTAGGSYEASYTITPATSHPVGSTFFNGFGGCANEDLNLNGILDLDPDEDFNGNTILDPGNVASVPPTVTLDATGSGNFVITYPKDHAYWVQVSLKAIASVAGTETTTIRNIVLPGAAADYSTVGVAPPGQISPYGIDATCNDAK